MGIKTSMMTHNVFNKRVRKGEGGSINLLNPTPLQLSIIYIFVYLAS